MKRKIKPVDLNDFLEADDINTTSIKGEMRKLWPAIHQKLTTGGWAARDVVKWFSERDVNMSIELFRVYLNELDRENGYQRSTKEFVNANQVSITTPSVSSNPKIKVIESASSVSSPSTNQVVRKPGNPSPKAITGILRGDVSLAKYKS